MDMQTIDRMLSVVKIAAAYGHPIFIDSSQKNWPAYIVDESIPGELAAFRLLDLGYSQLEYWEKLVLKGNPSYAVLPLEPVEYSDAGMALLRNGVGIPASNNISMLFWKIEAFLERSIRGFRLSMIDSPARKEIADILMKSKDIHEYRRLLDGVDSRFLLFDEARRRITKYHRNAEVFKKKYDPVISIISLERCNRGCAHCGADASPKTPDLDFSVIEKLSSEFGFGDKVSITSGEPFIWRDANRDLDLSDIVKHVADFENVRKIEIVTSGVDFSSPIEAKAAKRIAALPLEIRKKMKITLSISDFPSYQREGMDRSSAARQVQKESFAFFTNAGIRIIATSFLSQEKTYQEVVLPAALELFPDKQFIWSNHGQIKFRPVVAVGRGRRISTHPSDQLGATGIKCSSYPGVIVRDSPEDIFSAEIEPDQNGRYSQQGELGVLSNGDLVPGCCQFMAKHARIAHADDGFDEIRSKTDEFINKLDSHRRSGKLDCFRCAGSAERTSSKRRLEKNIGKSGSDKVLFLRCGR
jgi:hypothetical protein